MAIIPLYIYFGFASTPIATTTAKYIYGEGYNTLSLNKQAQTKKQNIIKLKKGSFKDVQT